MNYTTKPQQRSSLYQWLMARRIKPCVTNSNEPYEVQTFIGNQIVSNRRVSDPFIRTTVTVGWYHLLVSLLFRQHLEVRVIVSTDPITENYVLEGDPDYLSPARRKVFDACLNDALGAFGEME